MAGKALRPAMRRFPPHRIKISIHGKSRIFVVAITTALSLCACGQREPVAATPAKAAACGACHPRDGQQMAPMFPLLAGQNATYLSAQLRAFRDGSRNGTIMNAMARDLGNAQIDALANYRSEEHTSELQSLMRITYA